MFFCSGKETSILHQTAILEKSFVTLRSYKKSFSNQGESSVYIGLSLTRTLYVPGINKDRSTKRKLKKYKFKEKWHVKARNNVCCKTLLMYILPCNPVRSEKTREIYGKT